MKLIEMLFGCRHNWSWPFQQRKAETPRYQVCTLCGTQRLYNGPLI